MNEFFRENLTVTNAVVTISVGVVSVILLFYLFARVTRNVDKPKNKKKHAPNVQEHHRQTDNAQSQKVIRKKLQQEHRWQNKATETFTHSWMLTNFKGHTGEVMSMDFSSNNKYLASNAEEDGDATSETSGYSDTNSSSRPSSAEPDSPMHKGLSRRQKRNLKKRPAPANASSSSSSSSSSPSSSPAHGKRKTAAASSQHHHQLLQEWLNLRMTEAELAACLKPYLLTSEEMLNLGYPVETSDGDIIIYKGTDSPRVHDSETKRQFALDANAREFVPKSLQNGENDSGNSSGLSSGNTSDSSESFDMCDEQKNVKTCVNNVKNNVPNTSCKEVISKAGGKRVKSHHGSRPASSVSVLTLKAASVDVCDEIVQFPFYTFVPLSQKLNNNSIIGNSNNNNHRPNSSHFKTVTFYDHTGRAYEQTVLHHPMYPEYTVSDKATTHSCSRCGSYFHMQNGIYIGYNLCHYHVGKARRKQGQLHYPCCGESPESTKPPCTVSRYHVWNGLQMGFNGPFASYKKTKPRKSVPRDGNYGVYAVDCEMAYTDYGLEAVKVTVIAADGRLVYEAMIRPEHDIWDYNTYYSGITDKDLVHAKSLAQVQNDLMGFVSAHTILVGHGLENDLRALKIVHRTCVDTSALFPHHHGLPFKRGLKTLVRSYLNRNIQRDNQPHNSYEDAASCMELTLWKLRKEMCATA